MSRKAQAASLAIGSRNVAIYVAAVVVLAICTVAGVVGITLLRPAMDNTTLISTVVGVTAPVILGLLALILKENHLAVNSRLDQLLTTVRASGIKEGQDTDTKEA